MAALNYYQRCFATGKAVPFFNFRLTQNTKHMFNKILKAVNQSNAESQKLFHLKQRKNELAEKRKTEFLEKSATAFYYLYGQVYDCGENGVPFLEEWFLGYLSSKKFSQLSEEKKDQTYYAYENMKGFFDEINTLSAKAKMFDFEPNYGK